MTRRPSSFKNRWIFGRGLGPRRTSKKSKNFQYHKKLWIILKFYYVSHIYLIPDKRYEVETHISDNYKDDEEGVVVREHEKFRFLPL